MALALALAGCSAPAEPELATVYDAPAEGPEVVMQDAHPAGCEACCLQSALGYFGRDLTFDETMALFRRSEADFATAWWGDPMTEGAAYPPAVAEAANRALAGTRVRAVIATGASLDEVADEVSGGALAICWVTTDYAAPRWTGWRVGDWEMYANEHAVLVHRVTGGEVTAMDPLRGRVAMARSAFEEIWTACGSMAVVMK